MCSRHTHHHVMCNVEEITTYEKHLKQNNNYVHVFSSIIIVTR